MTNFLVQSVSHLIEISRKKLFVLPGIFGGFGLNFRVFDGKTKISRGLVFFLPSSTVVDLVDIKSG